jgi:hypothetical protein
MAGSSLEEFFAACSRPGELDYNAALNAAGLQLETTIGEGENLGQGSSALIQWEDNVCLFAGFTPAHLHTIRD